MKIGILTFHWGTNYGGVLQCYALQTFLEERGCDVSIINFAPPSFRDSLLQCFRARSLGVIFENIKTYIRDSRIDEFRISKLKLTQRYRSLSEVEKIVSDFDCLISGSDQVWNPFGIASYGFIYFLPFGGQVDKKISYAASFGCEHYPNAVMEKIKPLLKDFSAISVREKTGVSILNNSGIEGVSLMPDPTLLLKVGHYNGIFKRGTVSRDKYCFQYTLQKQQVFAQFIISQVSRKINVLNPSASMLSPAGIDDWLSALANSEFVVTNSFHGVVFSLIFKRPFVVVPIEGELTGMNDRIYTLLERFELSEKIITPTSNKDVFEIIDQPIDWRHVDGTIEELCLSATEFFACQGL